MSSNTVNGLPTALQGLSINGNSSTKSSNQLGAQDFLNLMVAQMKNQDPLSPTNSSQFLSQLAQFGTVSGINSLQSSFSTLSSTLQSNQALQASTMVGRTVLVDGTSLTQPANGGGASGAVNLSASTGDLVVTVSDAAGQVVRRIDMGPQSAGLVNFTWNGLNDSGASVPPGTYQVSADAMVSGQAVSQPTLVNAQVQSVTLSNNGSSPQLNLANIGPVSLDKVQQVM